MRRPRHVVIEPHVELWGWDRWQALVKEMPGIDFVQLGPAGTKTLDGARLIATANFDEACAWLACAWAAVLPEGDLHRAAVEADVAAVVLFGGAGNGHDGHVNLHCDGDWQALTPEIVAEALGAVLVG